MQDLVTSALDSASAMRSDVRFVAVHGTGTPLGDPIEVGALGATLGTGTSLASQLVLASNKVCRCKARLQSLVTSYCVNVRVLGRRCVTLIAT